MENIKKIISALLLSAFIFSLLGCSPNKIEKDNEKLSIISTIFPAYDFAKQVFGDDAEVSQLLPFGSETHSYEPTAKDIVNLSNCDVFIYVGGESDSWVDKILNSLDKKPKVIKMMDCVNAVEEEIKEGMEEDHGHDHEEVDPAKVKDRPLSDWKGSWVTIENALKNGDLNDFINDKAKDSETSFDEQKTKYTNRWKSDYANLEITENAVQFNNINAEYKYIGFKIVQGESSSSVWYGFEVSNTDSGAPKYIAFSDHGTGNDEDEHEEEHGDEHEEEAAHYHIRYGNESFEALTAIESWSPTYFPAAASGKEIAEAMMAHGHSEGEYDEHVWTSPKNAVKITKAIVDVACSLKPEKAERFQGNRDAYVSKLETLDKSFSDFFATVKNKFIVVGDRFPFRYFCDEYGIDYDAAFPGCSGETQANPKKLAVLMEKVKQKNISTVFYIEYSNHLIADNIAEETKTKTASLHSCHNITQAELNSGATYISLMENNLATLKEAMK